MKIKIICCILGSTIVGCSLFAQNTKPTQTVRGHIVEKQTQMPVELATVIVKTDSIQRFVVTDSEGKFVIENIPVGRCEVMASAIGFSEFVAANLLVYSGKETVLDIAMEEKVQELKEVVITARAEKEKPLNRMATASARMLSTEEANRYAGSWGDPSRMAANLAGVTAANDSRNDIVIRGNSPMGLVWRLDGFEIPNPNHFGSMGATGGNVGMINNNQLTNSDFYTGAFPAEFGNVTSGIFDLRLRNGNNQKNEFLLSLGFNGVEAGAEGPISQKTGASYMVNARYSFLEMLDATGMGISNVKGAIPEYQDASFKLNFPLKHGNLSWIGLLGASHINMKDDMTDEEEWTSGDMGQDVDMANKQFFTGLNYTVRLNASTRIENRLSYQFFNTVQDVYAVAYQNTSSRKYYECDLSEACASFGSTLHHRINVKDYLLAGAGVDYLMTGLDDTVFRQNAPITLHDGREKSVLVKVFAQWQHRFNDNISLIPGVYGQYYTFGNDYSIEPRLGFQWKTSSLFTINVGTGLYSQIQPRQVYFYEENGKYVNENLEMTRSWQSVVGFDWKIAPSLRFKTEVYYQSLYNVPVLPAIPEESILNFGDDYRNNWDYIFVNEGNGYNYGLEITFEKFFDKHYYFLFTASLYDSKYTGYDKVERSTKFNGNFTLNALAGYEWNIGNRSLLSVNIKATWLGGKRYVPATVNKSAIMERVYDYSQAYTQQLPDYFKIDLNVNMKTNYKRVAVEWFAENTNLTNHENIWMQYYNTNQQKERYIYQQGLTPMGGVRVYL